MYTYLGYLGGVISVAAYFPYVWAIWKDRHRPDRDPGKCKPKRASWIIWFVTSWIIVATMNENAAVSSIYQVWAYAFGATTTLLLTIRYGEGGWKVSDILSLSGAAIGLILWWLLNSAWYAFTIAMAVDAIGTLPVIKEKGRGEDVKAWALFSLGTLVTCTTVLGIEDKTLSSSNPRLSDIVYPIGMALVVTVPAYFVLSYAYINKVRSRQPKLGV
jgi:Ca2+/Na+ antiporter